MKEIETIIFGSEPENGDFMYYEYETCSIIAIFNCEDKRYFRTHAFCSVEGDHLSINCPLNNTYKYQRPATSEERMLLIYSMGKEGKEWDAINKKVIDHKAWRPKVGEGFYYVSASAGVCFVPKYNPFDGREEILRMGNCFKTSAEAEPYAKQFKRLLQMAFPNNIKF